MACLSDGLFPKGDQLIAIAERLVLPQGSVVTGALRVEQNANAPLTLMPGTVVSDQLLKGLVANG
jgi:hypothetical protein